MKISCTQEQKKILVDLLADFSHCIVQSADCGAISCRSCVEQNVEWEIENIK